MSSDEIIHGLMYIGATIQSISRDSYLVGFKGKNFMLNITDSGSHGYLGPEWAGQRATVKTLDDAIRVINCNGCGCE